MSETQTTHIEGWRESFALTQSSVITKLTSALKTTTIPNKITAKRLDEGVGYLSVIASLKIEWPETQEKLPKKVIVKIPSETKVKEGYDSVETSGDSSNFDEMNAEFMELAHNREVAMYHVIDNITGIGENCLKAPKMFAGELRSKQNSGLIFMEDFSEDTCLVDFFQCLNVTQTTQIFNEIAKLQAFSIANPGKWEGKVGIFGSVEMNKDWHDFVRIAGKSLQDDFGLLQNVSIDDICGLLTPEKYFQMNNPSREDTIYLVLVHGDLWSNNCLFRAKVDSKSASDDLVAVIDWQLGHPGSPLEDIVRVLTSSLDPDIRRSQTPKLLRDFYTKLTDILKTRWSQDHDVPIPFTFEQFEHEFEKMWVFGTYFMAIQFAFTIESSYANETPERRMVLARRTAAALEDALMYKQKKCQLKI